MTLRLLHTADWQLGKPFHHIPGDVGAYLRRARFDAVRAVARLAAEHEVAAVLVAGDVFDSNLVADQTVLQALSAMRGFAGPWVLLPGNHDAALAAGVWSRLPRLGCPSNCFVATAAEPLPLADGRLVVLPAPLTERHAQVDLSEWMDAAATPAAALRVGLAHGSVTGRLPHDADALNPIAADRAAAARLDYLALGDWHGTLEVAPRAWYAGTPEPDRFKANDSGNALLVEFEGPEAAPRVERLPIGHYTWQELSLDLTGADRVEAAIDRALAVEPPPADGSQRIVRLKLSGTLDLEMRRAVEQAVDRWRGELCHLELDDGGLLADPSERDLARLNGAPALGRVADELAQLARDGAPDGRAVAALALRLLYGEHERLGAGH